MNCESVNSRYLSAGGGGWEENRVARPGKQMIRRLLKIYVQFYVQIICPDRCRCEQKYCWDGFSFRVFRDI